MAEQKDIAWLAPLLVHIQTHLDDDLRLDRLAALAGYSPHHLQRRFQAAVGEPPRGYVERLRLERAGHLLYVTDDPAEAIAERVGYGRYETFSRAFSRRYGTSPRRYRADPIRTEPVGFGPNAEQGAEIVAMSAVRFEQRRPLHMAFIRHLGSYFAVDPGSYDRLVEWRAARWPDSPPGTLIGIGHDDPGVTAEADVRFDTCVTVPALFATDGEIAYQPFPAGTYAAITYHGPVGEPMMQAYAALYDKVNDSRRYQPGGLPAIEVYHTTRVNEWSTIETTDVLIPVLPG